jgi:uncharacterized protein DUF4926
VSIHELDTVVLERDLPEHGLRRGDLGAVVHVHSDEAIEVEFVRLSAKRRRSWNSPSVKSAWCAMRMYQPSEPPKFGVVPHNERCTSQAI